MDAEYRQASPGRFAVTHFAMVPDLLRMHGRERSSCVSHQLMCIYIEGVPAHALERWRRWNRKYATTCCDRIRS